MPGLPVLVLLVLALLMLLAEPEAAVEDQEGTSGLEAASVTVLGLEKASVTVPGLEGVEQPCNEETAGYQVGVKGCQLGQ